VEPDESAPRPLTREEVERLAEQLKNGQITPNDLKKAGVAPSDIADIQAKAKQMRPSSRGSERIIEDISKSKRRVQNALERVRQNPKDRGALDELDAAEQQLKELTAAQQDMYRREKQ
jgi:hypothetical protein